MLELGREGGDGGMGYGGDRFLAFFFTWFFSLLVRQAGRFEGG
jgi:hypothetical protein